MIAKSWTSKISFILFTNICSHTLIHNLQDLVIKGSRPSVDAKILARYYSIKEGLKRFWPWPSTRDIYELHQWLPIKQPTFIYDDKESNNKVLK